MLMGLRGLVVKAAFHWRRAPSQARNVRVKALSEQVVAGVRNRGEGESTG